MSYLEEVSLEDLGGGRGERGGEDGKLTIDTNPPPSIRDPGQGGLSSSSSSSPSSSPPPPTTPSMTTTTPTSHKFQPGDHVIRWEMLPIAWPIQIHGIVLSVNETTVVLVDFGLAAAASPSSLSSASIPPVSMEAAASVDVAPTTTTIPSSSSSPPSSSTTATVTETDVTLTAHTHHLEDIHLGGVEEHKEEPEEDDNDDDDNDDDDQEAETTTETGTNESIHPEPTTTTTTRTRNKKASWFSPDPKEMEIARKAWMEKSALHSKKIVSSVQRMHPTHKQRRNVIVLDDPSEWKKWKKVNYDKGLFGFGGGADHDHDDDDNNNINNINDDNEDGEASSPSGKSHWWSKMNPLKKSTNHEAEVAPDVESKEGDNEGTATTTQKWWQRPATTTTTTPTRMEGASSKVETEITEDASREDESGGDPSPTQASSSSPDGKSWWKKMTKSFEGVGQEAPLLTSVDTAGRSGASTTEGPKRNSTGTPTTTDDTSPSETVQEPAVAATPVMNPAMAKLMNQKKEDTEKESASSNKLTGLFPKGLFGKKSTGMASSAGVDEKDATSGEATTAAQKKLDLPTADPPKLVLARTRWLLKHGESVLPPYHAFHSNSECIAVFCKTGYWRNIQADVFLHSTAIGNAKTMGVATMGVAASVPLLAPVIAGLGIGMVAAPWLVLSSAKKQATDITQKMTDQFWAQAEPEVFLECIEHWSKLEEYYARQQPKVYTPTVPHEISDVTSQGEEKTQ